MININLNEFTSDENLENIVLATAEMALKHQHQDPQSVDLSIVFSNDLEIQKLNHQFLGIDAPTDVLSFSSDEVDPDSHNRYLGDIIISYTRAQSQAATRKGTTTSEVQLLIVHGMLHLFGFDHADDKQKDEMWVLQTQILNKLGVDINNSL